MRKLLIAAALIVQGLAAAATVEAGPTSWRIVQKAGDVSLSTGGFFPVALKPNAPLPEGAVVTTGATGRAILRRGAEQITLEPRSSIVLAADSSSGTYIRQDAGSVFFSIGKRRAPHFEVGTPFLAAIVKGTVFRVNVNGQGAAVHVSEGAVEVATVFRSAVTLVRPGASALVRATGKAKIQLLRDGTPARTVTENEGSWDTSLIDADIGDGPSPDIATADPGDADVGASAPRGGMLRASDAVATAKVSRTDLFATPSKRAAAQPPDASSQTKLAGRVFDANPLGVGRPAQASPRKSRKSRAGADSQLPMREIGFCLLALLLVMMATRLGKSRRRTAVAQAPAIYPWR